MNRDFVRKMLQAKQMEYQAIKEIMPEGMRRRVEELEDNAKELAKDIAMDLIFGAESNGEDDSNAERQGTGCKRVDVSFGAHEQPVKAKKRATRKINIDKE